MIERKSLLLHLTKVVLDVHVDSLSVCRLRGIVQAKLLPHQGIAVIRLECCAFIQPQHPLTLALEVAEGITSPSKSASSLEEVSYLSCFAPPEVFLYGHRLQREVISLLYLQLAVTSRATKAHHGK